MPSLRRWMPAALIVAGLSVLALYVFRDPLTAGPHRLPGLDAPIFYTWEVYTRQAMAAGAWPHWNPYFWGGTLHFADTLTASIYPPAMLLRWLPPAAFLAWMAVIHLLIGAAGTLWLARVIGLGWLAAASAALALTLGGAAASWMYLGHIVILYCVAWLPWTLALAIVSVRRGTVLPHPALPLVMVMHFLAGYLQGTIYITAAVCLYYLYSIAWRDPASPASRWRPASQLVVLGVLTAGLSAVQALPLTQLAVETARTQGLSYERAAGGGWEVQDLATFFWPFTGIDHQPVHRYLSHRIAYVGWLLACAVPFALLDRSRRRTVVFLLLLAAGAILFAFGENLPFYRLHYMLFPGLRLPGRILFVATLCVAVAGAIGLERLTALARERRWRTLAGGFAMLAALIAGASMLAFANAASSPAGPVHLWPWLPIAAVTALAGMAALATRAPRLALVPALAITAVDVTAFSAGGAHTVPIEPMETIERWAGPPDTGRVWSLCPNRLGSHELLWAGRPTLDGPIGVTLRDFQDWLVMIGGAEWPSDRLGPLPVRRDLLDHANVTTVIACEPLDVPALTLVSDVESTMVYRNQSAWPRAVWTCGIEELPRGAVEHRLRRGRYDERRQLVDRNWIHVRWAPGVSLDERRIVEEQSSLRDGFPHKTDTWRYHLADESVENVRALMAHPAVEDTHGVDRATGELAQEMAIDFDGDGRTEAVVGTLACDVDAELDLRTFDRPDGRVTVEVNSDVDGVVFFSEPYYPERRAFVNGRPAELLKANLAFTAVPVPAGRHVVEIRLVPRTFHAGLAITALTACVWGGAAGWMRRRRSSVAAADARGAERVVAQS